MAWRAERVFIFGNRIVNVTSIDTIGYAEFSGGGIW